METKDVVDEFLIGFGPINLNYDDANFRNTVTWFNNKGQNILNSGSWSIQNQQAIMLIKSVKSYSLSTRLYNRNITFHPLDSIIAQQIQKMANNNTSQALYLYALDYRIRLSNNNEGARTAIVHRFKEICLIKELSYRPKQKNLSKQPKKKQNLGTFLLV
jgi:hypothetical protein